MVKFYVKDSNAVDTDKDSNEIQWDSVMPESSLNSPDFQWFLYVVMDENCSSITGDCDSRRIQLLNLLVEANFFNKDVNSVLSVVLRDYPERLTVENLTAFFKTGEYELDNQSLEELIHEAFGSAKQKAEELTDEGKRVVGEVLNDLGDSLKGLGKKLLEPEEKSDGKVD